MPGAEGHIIKPPEEIVNDSQIYQLLEDTKDKVGTP